MTNKPPKIPAARDYRTRWGGANYASSYAKSIANSRLKADERAFTVFMEKYYPEGSLDREVHIRFFYSNRSTVYLQRVLCNKFAAYPDYVAVELARRRLEI